MSIETPQTITPKSPYIDIRLQTGPIKEAGVNGCQIDEVIGWCREQLVEFHSKGPCEENANAILALEEALSQLAKRTKNRESRGVEGTNRE